MCLPEQLLLLLLLLARAGPAGATTALSFRRRCPIGLAGDACDTLAWPACVVGPALRLDCRHVGPCACLQQCAADLAIPVLQAPAICYDSAANASTVAEVAAAPILRWANGQAIPGPVDRTAATARSHEVWWAPGDAAAACSSEGGCSGRGICTASGGCACLDQLHSPGGGELEGETAQAAACEELTRPRPCASRNCGGRGRCRSGVCDCDPGFRGDACEFPATERRQSPKQPAVYVYSLPSGLTTWRPVEMLERNTGWRLWRELLSSRHRSFDPKTADYFFVPVFPMLDVTNDELFNALEYVRDHFPHWNATAGHNHLVVGAWDGGLCDELGRPVFDRVTVLSHFGLTDMAAWCPCCTRQNERAGPLRAAIDVLIPDTMELGVKQRRPAGGVPVNASRPTRAFFGGGPTNKWRRELFLLSATPGWRVGGRTDLALGMSSSVFCIDVSASGFSTRFTLALFFGCVPAYMDIVEPAWQWVLPIDDFALRFRTQDLHRLPQILDAVSPAEVARLQAGGRRHWRRYYWRTLFGALPGEEGNTEEDAFELLMKVLGSRAGT